MKWAALIFLLSIGFSMPASSDTRDISIENKNLELAFFRHANEHSAQSHLNLLISLNRATFIIPSQDDAVKISPDTGKPLPESKFRFVLSATPDGKPLLAIFTNYSELSSWSDGKATSTWRVSAQEAWVFAKEFGIGVVVNPISAGWVMGEESITWLQNHPQ